jgi:hypothetical protein
VSNKVVARFLDGRVIKGVSLDVDPARPTFHVKPGLEKALEIKLADLKALFFVRSLEGNPTRREASAPSPSDSRVRGSIPVALRFADGETIIGLTIRFPPNRPYFFVVPVDPASNNIRILVNRSAVGSMETLPGFAVPRSP